MWGKKLKNPSFDITLKTSKSDETQKIELWQNSKTHIVTKPKNSNHGKTQKLKLWQSSKIQMVANIKDLNSDKTKKKKLP